MNGTGRSAVALVSYPGSGNTWLRGLLEQVTGICTGTYGITERIYLRIFSYASLIHRPPNEPQCSWLRISNTQSFLHDSCFLGSIYKDPVLRNSGFLGESIRTGTVLAVKVHGVHLSLQEPKVRSYIAIPYTLVNKRMLLIGAYTLISAAGLPALITLIKRICYRSIEIT